MKCPRCGLEGASYIKDGKSRKERRKTFTGTNAKDDFLKDCKNDKIKCKKCGIINMNKEMY